MDSEVSATPIYFNVLSKKLKDMKKSETAHEAYSRRANVMFGGIREQEHENCHHIISDVCDKVLGMKNMHMYIDKCHRVGRKNDNYPRDIIAKFLYHQDAEEVLSRASYGKHAKVHIFPDYIKDVKRDRAILLKVHRQAQQDGKRSKLVSNKLFYNGQAYTVDTVYNSDLGVEKISERRSENQIRFYGRFSLLSNFYPVDLKFKDTHFSSAEQLFQYKRAEELGQYPLALEIAMTDNPADCKHLAKDIPRDIESQFSLYRSIE